MHTYTQTKDSKKKKVVPISIRNSAKHKKHKDGKSESPRTSDKPFKQGKEEGDWLRHLQHYSNM